MQPWKVDVKKILQVAVQLLEIPSPTGYTDEIVRFLEEYLAEHGIEYTLTRKGSVLAKVPGRDNTQARYVTAHVDTLGAMVQTIKDDGTLKLSLVGGSAWSHLEGCYCSVFSESGPVSGTILMHKSAIHVYEDAADAKRNQENMEVRLDAKVKNKQDVKDLGVAVGDFVAFDPRTQLTSEGYLKSRHLDDKASAAVLLSWLVDHSAGREKLPYTTYFLFSTREETGQGGSSNVPAEVIEYLAVDMGALGDGLSGDEYSVSICAKDSSGPYHLGFRRHLTQLARANNIDYHVDIYPYYGSDASAALRAGHDVRHGLMGPGIAASHAFERTHSSSLEASAQLLDAYLYSPLCDDETL